MLADCMPSLFFYQQEQWEWKQTSQNKKKINSEKLKVMTIQVASKSEVGKVHETLKIL